MLRIKIHDGRLDTLEAEGLAEAEMAINFLTAYAPFMQSPPSADVHSTRRPPGRAVNPDDVADALRAIGRPASTSEIRKELHARGITTTPSRKDGDIREAMRDDPRFTRNAPGQGGRWVLLEWAESSGTVDAAHPDGAADSLRLS